MLATVGNTLRNIAGVPRTVTELPQTGLVAQHEVIRLPTARLAPGSSLAGRAAMWPAAAAEELVWATEAGASAIEQDPLAWAAGPAEAEGIA